MTVDEIPGGGVALYVILIFYPALAPGGSCPRAGLSSPYRVIAAFWRRLPAFCALFREGGGTRLLLWWCCCVRSGSASSGGCYKVPLH